MSLGQRQTVWGPSASCVRTGIEAKLALRELILRSCDTDMEKFQTCGHSENVVRPPAYPPTGRVGPARPDLTSSQAIQRSSCHLVGVAVKLGSVTDRADPVGMQKFALYIETFISTFLSFMRAELVESH